MTTSPAGLLLSMRLCRNAMICPETPSALACGSRCSSQSIPMVARIRSGELPATSAPPASSSTVSMPRSSSARSPDRLPGPELSKVSDRIGVWSARTASRAMSPPKECPSRCTPWPSGATASAMAATSVASSPGA